MHDYDMINNVVKRFTRTFTKLQFF